MSGSGIICEWGRGGVSGGVRGVVSEWRGAGSVCGRGVGVSEWGGGRVSVGGVRGGSVGEVGRGQ